MSRGISPPDPYITDESFVAGNKATTGRALRSLSLDTGVKNLILITAGQSNAANDCGSQFVPTNASAIDSFSIYDGAPYDVTGPMLGTNTNTAGPGNLAPRVADLLITNAKFSRVICCCIALGGATMAQWATGGQLNNRLTVIMKRLAARGWIQGVTNLSFGFLWLHGESDGPLGTAQATYQTGFGQVKSTLAAQGFAGRYFVPTQSYNTGTTYTNVTLAQAAVRNGSDTFDGGNLDSLTAASREADNLHFNTAGAASAATLIYNAMVASGAPY